MSSFSITSLADLLSFLAVVALAYRFFQYWRNEKSTTSKLFFYFVALTAGFIFIDTVTTLFFTEDVYLLKLTVFLTAIIQIPLLAVGGYFIFYLKFPRISPWWAFGIIFILGTIAAFLTIITPFEITIQPGGVIDWGSQPIPDVMRLVLWLFVFLSLFYILFQQLKTSRDPFVRTKAVGMIIMMVFGAIIAFFDFFLGGVLKLSPIFREIILCFLSVIIFILAVFVQKPPSSFKKEKYIPPPPSQIQW